ncbi:MAG: hypothetical protein Q9211_006592, partial [Gyalolechia sp. 1 TL-2023]
MRTDISTIRLSIQLAPSIKRSQPSDASRINQLARRIMDDSCHDQPEFLDLATAISKSTLQSVEGSFGVETSIVFPTSVVSQYSGSGLKFAYVTITASRPTTLLSLPPEPMVADANSIWDLKVSVDGQAAQEYQVTLGMEWTLNTEDHDDGSQAQCSNNDMINQSTTSTAAEPEPSAQDLFPASATHRHVASFIESKTHLSLDAMAFEASRVAFKVYQTGKDSCHARQFRIKLANAGAKMGKVYSLWNFTAELHNNFKRAEHDRESSYGDRRVLLALGSNVGDRIGTIEQACSEMSRRGLKVLKTSSLYETDPMYKTDQPSFINGVCQVQTTLAPLELLDELKSIEQLFGRVKTVENGPRTIDLDILLYDNYTIDHERLTIPHPRISERDFVLKPLC